MEDAAQGVCCMGCMGCESKDLDRFKCYMRRQILSSVVNNYIQNLPVPICLMKFFGSFLHLGLQWGAERFEDV
jgi:hypothetical protein